MADLVISINLIYLVPLTSKHICIIIIIWYSIHGGTFLLVDVTNVWDSVITCCWDECCEDVCNSYSDNIVLEHVPECDSAIDSCSRDEACLYKF